VNAYYGGVEMPEYNLGLSQKLAETAEIVAVDGLGDFDAVQTVMYLSLLASEIALKALLEQAGQPVTQIRARSHNLKLLLEDLGRCQIQVEIAPDHVRWMSASSLRAVTVDPNYGNATVGTLLEAESVGASTYPNQIRYGESFRHYPPQLIMKMALEIAKWAKQHWEDIRLS
jgi:HEPN domain-containing protein